MTKSALSSREIRERSEQLRALLWEWDPIGVRPASDWPRDEYDCLVGPLLTLLDAGASTEEITLHVHQALDEHFGLTANNDAVRTVADRVRRWFDRAWRSLAEPVTIFVALMDEGVDVWRPVQARSLGGGLYRIIGADGDTSDETWQFPAGAIVQCEDKQFANGRSEMTAVAQVR